MRYSRTVALGVGLATAAATALYIVPNANASGGKTLRFTNQLDTRQAVDAAPSGPSAGDSFYVSSHVVSGATGHTAASCTIVTTQNGGITQCEVDFILADGTITSRGLTNNANKLVNLVVTGGTGAYASHRASGTLTPTPTGSEVVLQLR